MNYRNRKKVKEHSRFNGIMAFFAGAIVALAIINVVTYNRMPQITKDIYQMKRICKASYQVIDGKLENSCGDLIDRVEEQGFNVLNDNKGNFWVEVRK